MGETCWRRRRGK